MSRPLAWLLAAMVACGLGALGWLLYKNLEPYNETLQHGPSPEAQANPYLAAEQFLRQRGLNVTQAKDLSILPTLEPRQETLMLLGERSNMSPRQTEQVLDWVRAGGRLIFVAEALWDEEQKKSGDLLLDRLSLQQFLSEDLKEPAPKDLDERYPKLTRLYLENEEAPAYFSFDTSFHLEDPDNLAQTWANSANATHMMQLGYGLGTIVVVTDSELWKNPGIGKYDNAWLLWYLNQDTNVSLVFNTDHNSLLSQIWRYFPHAVVALLMLIGLWLWHVGLRHGPLQQPQPKARRQLLEHLRASADFLLRRSGQHKLLQALQQDIQRRARLRHPGFERLAVAEQWQVLSRLTRQPTLFISQALRPRPKERLSSADFSRQVAHLQTLRNAL